jgi:hypothetical protein
MRFSTPSRLCSSFFSYKTGDMMSTVPGAVGRGLCRSAFVQVPVQRRTGHIEILRYVVGDLAASLHPLCGGDVLGIVDLAGPPELGAVSARCFPLQRRPNTRSALPG